MSVGLTCLVAVYAVMVGTQAGRTADMQWTAQALPKSSADFQTNQAIMRAMSPTHILAVGLILVLATMSVRQWRRALAISVASSGLVISAAILKSALPRPVFDGQALANSFPSGHVAGAAAIAVALVLMTSGRWRWPALLAGMTLISLSATGAVSLQWHRPSDALGAAFLALSWYGVGLLLLQWRGRADLLHR